MPAPQEIFGYFFNWKSLRGSDSDRLTINTVSCVIVNYLAQKLPAPPPHDNHLTLINQRL
ncbi:hypothetical protein QHH11_17625 [Aphanizomenon sp. PH219]|uniref:Transposase n=1 Tax=Dolichospermum heterosporum TAC447 TaxID=747523 RepID=A0ABY5LXI2_9CYAN|nr:hypothetical protein [Dolichospermum heterosporum]MDK2410639.1 hypothetical protein [Aphanizomenon sp. 202]MDK2460928.1 hypothetical protein [Aphanizomenon sp. PH219]UUO15709.1 hypothetical protein NG743_01195 [Dolichospermum heterosporum TAC447]